ncbi:hypothetical protein PUNSTDRAFT_122395 [Punctularia strigosozonata HHB-11173 SS5]|uniref:uncharacterized protein n=1 Tax=Punctularia strigosozonata (strain HHB-11173) TaxID=741275 RepID=UPI0004417067|nr:uncharacterized protein PUNSTDRAFT_122395 [Punctularia strigosozonata HHB-11173 SS5]EIN05512.1 hypothetical protein PUNSTDRAFT_122395 [Punctularia strigosozonata HHB-11173 SS5]
MFGEEVSESPRAPSPWNNLVATPPASSPHLKAITGGELTRIPKLIPEVEEGNVEYKLKLLNPTAARFARLVTQLKWRLLEGGGQAYYELGVADSGMLVGLSRADLEASLETLEMMAGEIGASVIVVKEVEVPRAMVEIAEKLALRERDDSGTSVEDDGWTMMRMGSWESRAKKKSGGSPLLEAASSWTPGSEPESEEDVVYGSASLATIKPGDFDTLPTLRLEPPPENGDANPLFSMDPELEATSSEVDLSSSDVDSDAPSSRQFDIDLAIASVFKPRPIRRRVQGTDVQQGSRRGKDKDRPAKVKRRGAPPSLVDSSTSSDPKAPPTKAEAKALKRRAARDKRRDERRKALLGQNGDVVDTQDAVGPAAIADTTSSANAADDHAILVPEPMVDPVASEAPSLAARLDGLHVSHEDAPILPTSDRSPSSIDDGNKEDKESDRNSGGSGCEAPAGSNVRALRHPVAAAYEPRLIVEALVVRKMSLEEGFLDFEGFEVV